MNDGEDCTVAGLAAKGRRIFIYEYDFRDRWEDEVGMGRKLPPDPAFKHPVCLAGANACPPEDCGGIGGYYNLLEILADPKHPGHEEMKEWNGGELDAARFDLDEINLSLDPVAKSKEFVEKGAEVYSQA